METSSPSSFMIHRRKARYCRAYAARLAEQGAHIAVCDLDQTAAQQSATDLTHRDRRYVPVWM
jgi:hypothetical protein